MHRKHLLILGMVCLTALVGCTSTPTPTSTETHAMSIQRQVFGTTPDGRQVDIYTLTNSHGVEARITNFGGIVVSLKAPDRNGNLEDIVLG